MLLSAVRCALISLLLGILPGHSTCVSMFSQVRLVYLIFAVPQTQKQSVASEITSAIDEE